jgi:SAM-dependent methyltransferase
VSNEPRRDAAPHAHDRASAAATAGPVERRALPSAGRPGGGASFDRLAVHYDRLSFLIGGELRGYLTACLPARGGRAVDLGCGTGRHAAVLARRFTEVLAVDISAPMLALAQRHRSTPVIRYEQRDLLDVTPARDGTFDLVFSAYALHHLPDLGSALRQIRSLVGPGGHAILVDLCDVPHDRTWFLAEARRTLVRDVLRRRRPVREARELYRLSTDAGWLDHQVVDRPLPPGTFEQVYGEVFPGAEFTALYIGGCSAPRSRPAPSPGSPRGRPAGSTATSMTCGGNSPARQCRRRRDRVPGRRQAALGADCGRVVRSGIPLTSALVDRRRYASS